MLIDEGNGNDSELCRSVLYLFYVWLSLLNLLFLSSKKYSLSPCLSLSNSGRLSAAGSPPGSLSELNLRMI